MTVAIDPLIGATITIAQARHFQLTTFLPIVIKFFCVMQLKIIVLPCPDFLQWL